MKRGCTHREDAAEVAGIGCAAHARTGQSDRDSQMTIAGPEAAEEAALVDVNRDWRFKAPSRVSTMSTESGADITDEDDPHAHVEPHAPPAQQGLKGAGAWQQMSDEVAGAAMIRHIACSLNEAHIAEELDKAGFAGKYDPDSIYLPRRACSRRTSNLGYAFVSFNSAADFLDCQAKLSGKAFGECMSTKTCEIVPAHREFQTCVRKARSGNPKRAQGFHTI